MNRKKLIYTNNFEDDNNLNDFFNELDSKLALGKRQNKNVVNDYIDAIRVLQTKHLNVKDIIKRLDISRLGNIYKDDQEIWYSLDNSALIYPLTLGHGSMAMFRLSYYLNDEVSKSLLQIALNNTIKRFPTFETSLKKGFFWHFLDTTKSYFKVRDDNPLPCTIIRLSNAKSQVFKVYCYKNRISIDFFHVLTDGTGGLFFLNCLVNEYFRIIGKEVVYQDNLLDNNGPVDKEELEDAFDKVPIVKGASSFADKFPLQLQGTKSYIKKRVLHFTMNTNDLLYVSRSRGITITALMLSYIFIVAKRTSNRTKGSFFVQLPVNMRQYYPTKSLRNFSLFATIKENIKDINDIDALSKDVMAQIKDKTSQEKMREMSYMTNKLARSINYIPLLVKYAILKVIYPFLSEKVISTTFTNLGEIKLPNTFSDNIEKADFVLGVQNINRAVCSMVSIKGKTVLTISKITSDTSFEDEMAECFRKDGINIEVTGGDNFGL